MKYTREELALIQTALLLAATADVRTNLVFRKQAHKLWDKTCSYLLKDNQQERTA